MIGASTKFLKIDLNEFKLHLSCNPEIDITLYFNTPPRKFYLAVIALLVNEMKKKDNITSTPLQNHLDELILFNKTIGKEAGSSKKELLLQRIYKKWKDKLPDLGKAPLFKVIGKKKRYDDAMEKVFLFSEAEKDCWANLFEYMGSHENVRLKFALNKLSLSLEDAGIIYGDSSTTSKDAWNNFIADLKKCLNNPSGDDAVNAKDSVVETSPKDNEPNQIAPDGQKRMIKSVSIGLIAILVSLLFWQYYKPISSVEKASVDRMAFPLPDKPSIAVLAFDNMSGNPSQEYFSDSISESIIATLSKIDQLFVIARNSSFTYKGKAVKIQQVARDLGVRYVLEGSVQKTEDRVRVTTQLIDAVEGHHLWSERYDRNVKDIFDLQDEIVMKIVTALQVKLAHGEQARLFDKGFTNINAYSKYLEAYSEWQKDTEDGIMRFGSLAEEIVDLEPESQVGYRLLGWYHRDLANRGISRRENLKKSFAFAQKALSLDENDGLTLSLMCDLYSSVKNYEKAISAGKKAVELEPGSSQNHLVLGGVLC